MFVEFFIPPPPPLPGDEESSDSDSDTQDEGYDITGIGRGMNILDYSEQVVKKLTTKSEPRGKGPTKLTTINMESILNNATRGGSSSIPDPQFRTGRVSPVRRLPSGSFNLHAGVPGAKTDLGRPLRAQSMPIPYEGHMDLSASTSSESDASSSSMGSASAAECSTEVVIQSKQTPIKKLSPIEETTPPLESLELSTKKITTESSTPPPSSPPPLSSASSVPSTPSIPTSAPSSTSASSPSSPALGPSSTSPLASQSTASGVHRTSSLPSSPSRSRSPQSDHSMPLLYSPNSTPPPSETRPFTTSPQTPKRGFDERVLSPRPESEDVEAEEGKGEDRVSYHSSRDHSPVVFALELAQAREDLSNRTSPKTPTIPIPTPIPTSTSMSEGEKGEKGETGVGEEKEEEEEEVSPKDVKKLPTPTIPTEPGNEEKEPPKEDPLEEIGAMLSPRQRRMNRLSLSLVNTDFEIDSPRKSRVFDPLMVKHMDTMPTGILEDIGEIDEDVRGLDLDSELPLTDMDEDEKLSQFTDEEHDQSKRLRRVGRFGKESIVKDVKVETWN